MSLIATMGVTAALRHPAAMHFATKRSLVVTMSMTALHGKLHNTAQGWDWLTGSYVVSKSTQRKRQRKQFVFDQYIPSKINVCIE